MYCNNVLPYSQLPFQHGQGSKPTSSWNREGNQITCKRVKNLVEVTKKYQVNDQVILGKGIFGVVRELNAEKGLKSKVYKQSELDLKKEFEISTRWENKSIGLSIHPNAYFPSIGGFDSIMILHRYHKTLKDLINHHELTFLKKIEVICQVSKGVATLHSLDIAHNDIWADNIMYDRDLNRYDLIDFGSAEELSEENRALQMKGDLDLLSWLIFMLLGNNNSYARVRPSQPTLQDLLKSGLKDEHAREVFEFCRHMPKEAEQIHQFFNHLKNAYENEIAMPPFKSFELT